MAGKGVDEMKECIFCKIIAGEIPAAKVYEDEYVISFLDIMPANEGHCLVIPKKHRASLLDLSDTEIEKVMKAVKKVAKAVSLSVGNGSYNIVMNNGKEAGQVVPHAHIHIIPRFGRDMQKISWKPGKYKDGEMDEVKENIMKFIE